MPVGVPPDGAGPNMILDDGGDATMFALWGAKLEAGATLGEPENEEEVEFQRALKAFQIQHGHNLTSTKLQPVRWADDRRELKLLSQRSRIPLSAGESELTSYGCRALVEEGSIQILQFDCTMFGGFTEGRKMAALCELNRVQVAPHHDCFIHAHLVASTPAGCIVQSFTDPERDPLQAELFENPPKIADGWLTLNEAPGLGLTLSEAAVKKFGEKILSA